MADQNTTAKELQTEMGTRSEAIAAFVAEAEVVIGQIDPELSYNRADLQGFVRGAWPYDGTAADCASEFASAVKDKS